MRIITILLLLFVGINTSCTSEYEERLEEGKSLVNKLEIVEKEGDYTSNKDLSEEINSIRNEIILLSKVSGNEELFLNELFGNLD